MDHANRNASLTFSLLFVSLYCGCGSPRSTPAELGLTGSEWQTYEQAARRIVEAARASDGAWRKLETLCLDFGHRLSGSTELERVTAWAAEEMRRDGHEGVALEPVTVPHWERGAESATMIAPREAPLAMLGLGGSIGTPPEGITAEVAVVEDEAGLERIGRAGAEGRIVLFNNRMPRYDEEHGSRYGETVRFRGRGAILAAKQGAVACLIRSVTARSLRSPHTGAMRYDDSVPKIPAAALSIEDAETIARLIERGQKVVVRLHMSAQTLPPSQSANVVGELRGREWPEETVVIGGHIDAWDVGHGAHDDGAGCVMSMEAITLLRKLNLIPRRTIRVVLFTNEENGLAGGTEYARRHAAELPKHVGAIESDAGGFAPRGFGFEHVDPVRQGIMASRMTGLMTLFAPLGSMRARPGGSGADISRMQKFGVPLLGLEVEGSTYFDYHHSHGDTLDKVVPRELQDCTAAMAIMAYVLAELPGRIDGDSVGGRVQGSDEHRPTVVAASRAPRSPIESGLILVESDAPRPWTFESDAVDILPRTWEVAETAGKGTPAEWRVATDGGYRVLQVRTKNTDRTFNLCVLRDVRTKDLSLSVRVRADAGREDAGGGLIWRYQNADNYYIARWNPLEANFRVYKVTGGRRLMLDSVEAPKEMNRWMTMRVEHVGHAIRCTLNDSFHLEATDDAISSDGRIGLWTKADAGCSFDDLTLVDLGRRVGPN